MEEEEGDGREREAAAAADEAEIAMRDKRFSAYKAEMEKYLSLFDGGGGGDGKKKKKAGAAARKGQGRPKGNNKPVIPTVGAMKDKFEALDTDSQAKAKAPQKAAVGKLDLVKVRTLAAANEESEQADKAKSKSFSAPVVIDKDAFDRTMRQFEHYRDSNDTLTDRPEQNSKKKIQDSAFIFECEQPRSKSYGTPRADMKRRRGRGERTRRRREDSRSWSGGGSRSSRSG